MTFATKLMKVFTILALTSGVDFVGAISTDPQAAQKPISGMRKEKPALVDIHEVEGGV